MAEPIRAEIDGATIVLLGEFNPAIFQPAWFGHNGLLGEQEVEAAQINVIHPEVADFKLDWLQLQVTQNRFLASAADAGHSLPLKDLVMGTFSLLSHTPATQIGCNRHMHFKAESEEESHLFGDMLAPKDLWRTVMAGRPGLRSLTIEAQRPGSSAKYVRVTVQPSNKLVGFYISTNEHYEVTAGEGIAGLLSLLERDWVQAWEYGLEVATHLIARVRRTS